MSNTLQDSLTYKSEFYASMTILYRNVINYQVGVGPGLTYRRVPYYILLLYILLFTEQSLLSSSDTTSSAIILWNVQCSAVCIIPSRITCVRVFHNIIYILCGPHTYFDELKVSSVTYIIIIIYTVHDGLSSHSPKYFFFRRKSHPISLVARWLITPLPPPRHVFFRSDKARPLTLHTHTHTPTRASAVAGPFEWCIDVPPYLVNDR